MVKIFKMKKPNHYFLFILLYLLINLFINTGCGCKDSYVIMDRDLLIVKNLNNSGAVPNEWPLYYNTDTIPARAYGIRIKFKDRTVEDHISNVERYKIVYQRQITGLNIYCLNNFDLNHPAGANLNDYFKIRKAFYSRPKNAVPINSMIDEINNSHNGEFDLLLYQEPELDTLYQFVITVNLSDGNQLSDITQIVKLTI